jgi:hypothetical protein
MRLDRLFLELSLMHRNTHRYHSKSCFSVLSEAPNLKILSHLEIESPDVQHLNHAYIFVPFILFAIPRCILAKGSWPSHTVAGRKNKFTLTQKTPYLISQIDRHFHNDAHTRQTSAQNGDGWQILRNGTRKGKVKAEWAKDFYSAWNEMKKRWTAKMIHCKHVIVPPCTSGREENKTWKPVRSTAGRLKALLCL